MIPPLVVALKTVTLLLGGLITYYALRASRRTGARPLRVLAVGFGIVTLGSLVAGVADQAVGVDTSLALTVESVLTALGFLTILYSLYAD